MTDYRMPVPRFAFTVTAFALTALTLGLSVVVPAQLDSSASQGGRLTEARSSASAPIDVIITPTRIDVIGVRETTRSSKVS